MKKLAVAGALALALGIGGCATVAKLLKNADALCAAENSAHAWYLSAVAPLRPADKVEKAKKFHTAMQAACAAGSSVEEILKAYEAAAAARTE